jgi:hypothetical protein
LCCAWVKMWAVPGGSSARKREVNRAKKTWTVCGVMRFYSHLGWPKQTMMSLLDNWCRIWTTMSVLDNPFRLLDAPQSA